MASARRKSTERRPSPAGTASSAAPSATPAALAAAWTGFWLVLAACLLWVGMHAYLVDRVTVRICEQVDAGLPPEKRLPVFLHGIAFDGYVWNRHAEMLGRDGHWRLRHTDFDNAPAGREVHWNSGFAWYLRGLGEAYRRVTGEPLRHSIFRMSIWANPLLLAVALALFPTLSARRFGPLCGTVIALGMVAVPAFYEGFMPAYPDHHGLIAFSLLGMLFGIAWAGAGWVQAGPGEDFAPPRSLEQAGRGMVFSALCGAAGLWMSALSTAPVLAATGAAVLAAVLAYGRPHPGDGSKLRFHPALWRRWALWGAGGSLFFYILEYFPSDIGMRMEVNHPLYALAWLGGGSMVALLGAWLSCAPGESNPFPWVRLVLAAAAACALPVVVMLGDDRFYAPKDPFLWQVHRQIAEFLPLMTRIEMGGMSWLVAFGWLPLLLVAAAVLLAMPRVGQGTKAVLLLLSIPVVLISLLQFYQTRWGILTGPLYIALAGIAVPQSWRLVPHRAAWRGAAAATMACGTALFVAPTFRSCFAENWTQFRSGRTIAITPFQGLAVLHRQMARAILDSAGGAPVVVLSSPNSSCMLASLGGFRTIGTLYWENAEGLRAAAAGLTAQNDDEALAFMRGHGVTHVSLMSWENFLEPFFHILYPEPPPGVRIEQSFGRRALFDRDIPSWARPLPFAPNQISRRLGQTILMLQVAPGQGSSPDAPPG